MKKLFLALFTLITITSYSQNKNISEKSYIEVSGQADTLVVPNKIWINILLMEKDFKGKKSVEDLEKEMIQKLQETGVDIQKNLTINDISSNFKSYLLKQTDIFKSKSYSLLVSDAKTASKVFIGLENIGISNLRIEKTENSEEKRIKLLMNNKAILNAKQSAESFAKPLNQKIGSAWQISNYDDISNQLAARVYGIAVKGTRSFYSEEPLNEPNIEFEKIKISSSVQVRFVLE